jgi:hypothetical protein
MLGALMSKEDQEAAKALGAKLASLIERQTDALERIAVASERTASYLAQINNRVEHAADRNAKGKRS